MPPLPSYTCLRCSHSKSARIPNRRLFGSTGTLRVSHKVTNAKSQKPEVLRSSNAPRISIDIKHIRENVSLYKQNCIDRKYGRQSTSPAIIQSLFDEWQGWQRKAAPLRQRTNLIMQTIAPAKKKKPQESIGMNADKKAATLAELRGMSREQLIEEARTLKETLAQIEEKEIALQTEMQSLAVALPVLASDASPRGDPKQIKLFNSEPAPPMRSTSNMPLWRSHVDIGEMLDLLDFAAASKTAGWGWYYLLNEAAQLEQALVQYAIDTAMKRSWRLVSPPSMVYSHIGSACGFQPRDSNNEQQVYTISQSQDDVGIRPSHSLAGTAEIPLAGMMASSQIDAADFPLKRIAVSRCYRAEAGARGKATQGLYRVHEFTKVEMFAWTLPEMDVATELFEEMVDLQVDIISSLGLCGRVLEMPTTDLGASAMRKQDIEAWFPSRQSSDDGWGELTSTSICGDYQTRRLDTRMKDAAGKLSFPYTLNGTAMAVPRVIAAILENGWREEDRVVVIPEVLRPYMGGKEFIGPAKNLGVFGKKPNEVPPFT